jgi:hypothetical protein
MNPKRGISGQKAASTEGPPSGRQEMHLTVTFVIAGFRFYA